ncbi:hypothetical protein [Streptomyces sp. NPDC054765]
MTNRRAPEHRNREEEVLACQDTGLTAHHHTVHTGTGDPGIPVTTRLDY